MSSREWNKIDPAERVIVEKYLDDLPIRLGAMAKELGVKVKLSSLPSNLSGLIRQLEGGEYEIKINRHESRGRQRFTLAHEISHFLLHRDIIDNSENGIQDNVLYRSGQPKNIEYEANRLAADLVMPRAKLDDKVLQLNSNISEDAIEYLAHEFGVSKAAMEIRVSN